MLENLKDKIANTLGAHLDRTAEAATARCTWTWFHEEEMPAHMLEKAMQPIDPKS